MGIKQFRAERRATIHWAGGTSTELFIHPSDASFAEGDFLFRISTATVETEESTFTFFKGVTRHLMVLEGWLELIHEGRYARYLEPFDQDVFSGEWETRSKGKAADFNLMLKGGTTGLLTHHSVAAGNRVSFIAGSGYYFIYMISGSATLNCEDITETGDLLQVKTGSAITLSAITSCELVVIEIWMAALP